ncbi:hypothetical protein LOK49_LG10G01229 [Camellia lanceoleosa]|uniref:Uncharacterized protein n=1 Tax=Camellia lanceoleosa TaxID=1840588 RepID=A0ACC0G961_9ERIC|nr:hypothetical protein LOK49_LG10G01229 [Camellia lanceoleosa]
MLEAAAGDTPCDHEDTTKFLCLYMCGKLFFATSSETISWTLIWYVDNIGAVKLYDWSGAVCSMLMCLVRDFHQTPEKVSGCVVALMFWLCEHTNIVKPKHGHRFPRFLIWDVGKVNSGQLVEQEHEVSILEGKGVQGVRNAVLVDNDGDKVEGGGSMFEVVDTNEDNSGVVVVSPLVAECDSEVGGMNSFVHNIKGKVRKNLKLSGFEYPEVRWRGCKENDKRSNSVFGGVGSSVDGVRREDVIDVDIVGDGKKIFTGFGIANHNTVWKMISERENDVVSTAYNHYGDRAVIWVGRQDGNAVFFSDVRSLVRQVDMRGNVIDAFAEVLSDDQDRLNAGKDFPDSSYFFSSICWKNIVTKVQRQSMATHGLDQLVGTQDFDMSVESVAECPQQRPKTMDCAIIVCTLMRQYVNHVDVGHSLEEGNCSVLRANMGKSFICDLQCRWWPVKEEAARGEQQPPLLHHRRHRLLPFQRNPNRLLTQTSVSPPFQFSLITPPPPPPPPPLVAASTTPPPLTSSSASISNSHRHSTPPSIPSNKPIFRSTYTPMSFADRSISLHCYRIDGTESPAIRIPRGLGKSISSIWVFRPRLDQSTIT